MGVGYAKWSDSVTIVASVKSGEVKTGVADRGAGLDWGWNGCCYPNSQLQQEEMPDDVRDLLQSSPNEASTDMTASEGEPGVGPNCSPQCHCYRPSFSSRNEGYAFFIDYDRNDCNSNREKFYDKAIEKVKYPRPSFCWKKVTYWMETEIGNGGTIPVKITHVGIDHYSGTWMKPWMVIDGWKVTEFDSYHNRVARYCGWGESSLMNKLNLYQLHAGHVLNLDVEFHFDLCKCHYGLLPLNKVWEFTWQVTTEPWNLVG